MDCDICFEDKILMDDIAFFKCTHHICKKCYNSLKKRLCPFCRKKIKILSTKQVDDNSQIRIFQESLPEDDYSDEDNYYDVEYENDFIIPVIRKNRNELKRKSKEKKKFILASILTENYNNNFLKIIPTLRKRKYKKLQLLFK